MLLGETPGDVLRMIVTSRNLVFRTRYDALKDVSTYKRALSPSETSRICFYNWEQFLADMFLKMGEGATERFP